MTERRHLKVGLICDSSVITPYVSELREWVDAQPGLEAWLRVRESDTRRWGSESFASQCARRLVLGFEQWRYKRSAQYRTVRPVASAQPTATDCERESDCDVLISFGPSPADATRLPTTAADVLCVGFGHGGESVDPWVAFQEVNAGEAKTCFSIRRISRSGGDAEVILNGAFPTQTYFVLSQAHLFKRSFQQIKGLLSKLASGRPLVPSELPFPSSAARSEAPRAHHWLGYLCRTMRRTIAGKVRSALRLEERWSVSYLDRPWQAASMHSGIEIDNPSKRYFADPFIVADSDEVFCFVEDYFDERRRGVISVLKLGGGSHRFIGHALEEDFHLSFPFVFEHDGRRFMCPETNEARQIRIYECLEFPLQWKLHSIAMQNVAAVDTMIFPHGDRWWMLTNLDSSGVGEYGSELHLFYSDDPLDANWIAHPQNPLRVDPEFARNAGMLRDGTAVFRVAQARGFGSYGVHTTIFQIEHLDVDHYREHAMKMLTPTFKSGISGTHHFHGNAGYSTWDQKR